MTRSSAWRRILHHGVPEDQLTEILRLVLSSNDDLARSFVGLLAGPDLMPSPGSRVKVETQVSVEEKLIDLVLDWEHGVVWVEVKRDLLHESYPEQLARYAALLEARAERLKKPGKLAYLTRPGVEPPESVVDAHRTWTDVADLLRAQDDLNARELARFLAEENLGMTPVDHQIITTIEDFDRSRAAMLGLLDAINPQVEAFAQARGLESEHEHPGRGNLKRRAHWNQWYRTFRLRTPWPEGLLLEWNLRRRESGRYRDRVTFAAGLTIEDPDASVEDYWHAAYLARLNASSPAGPLFEQLENEEDRGRIYRLLPLQELLNTGENQRQAAEVADFILRTFSAVLDAGPPRASQ